MDFLKPPGPLSSAGEIAKNWQAFKQRFEFFLAASEQPTGKPRTEPCKTALLLSVAGEEAIEIFNTFSFGEDESRNDYATVIAKFDAYCAAQQNEVHERYVFRMRVQAPGELVEPFLRDLKNQARACNFGSQMDAMIRDQIVYGTNDEKLRERLLRDTTLNLLKAEQVAKAAEATAAQQKVWARDESHIDAMRKEHPSKQSELTRHYKCPKCARMHPPRRCPAFGKTCRKCQRPNHFATCCRRFADIGELQGGEDNFDILDVSSCAANQHDWTVVGQIKNVPLEFKVDTGAQANLLPFGCYRKIRPKPPLKPSSAVLRSYGGGVIKHDGVIRTELALGDRCAILDFFVVSKGHQAILGLQASENLGLVSRIHAVSRNSSKEVARNFRHLFTGTGCVERVYRMVLRDDATPIVQAARRVPLALQEPLQELGRMERAGIITKVTEPTDWVSPLVIVRKKDGKIRVCIDPRRINQCIKREHYTMPRREDIEAELAGATVFTRLDANSGFHQIPLDNETSRIGTFATPFGRYRFLRLPFGIASRRLRYSRKR
nr:uncharacterized protein LOC129386661 [Dermacentor andersoni]